MKQVVWYLPSGSGGMAALYRTRWISIALTEWAQQYAPIGNIPIRLDNFSKNGFRYCGLKLQDDYATIFALTWDNTTPQTRYEYINDLIPQIPHK